SAPTAASLASARRSPARWPWRTNAASPRTRPRCRWPRSGCGRAPTERPRRGTTGWVAGASGRRLPYGPGRRLPYSRGVTEPERGELLYEGKAKRVYATPDPCQLIVEYKDDATAFDARK